jgi:hypothetical protein
MFKVLSNVLIEELHNLDKVHSFNCTFLKQVDELIYLEEYYKEDVTTD